MKPYVSVVIVGRNDDYGENFQQRIETFVRHLDHQAKDHPGLLELVIVEWNPLADKDPLSQVLPEIKYLESKIITVSPENHSLFGSERPVLEFPGKNVGIRRASGEFILVTNPDIVFTDELVQFLSQRTLDPDTVYRTDRYDFVNTGISDIDCDDIIDFAVGRTFQAHIVQNYSSCCAKVQGAEKLLDLPKSQPHPQAIHTNACGDFMLASRRIFEQVNGLNEDAGQRWHVDSYSLIRLLSRPSKQSILMTPYCIFHAHHERKGADAPWDPQLALMIGRQPGKDDWGLKNMDLPEITLTKS